VAFVPGWPDVVQASTIRRIRVASRLWNDHFMAETTICSGCGARLAKSDWILDRRLNASPECWQLYGDVTGYELSHPSLGRLHQLMVDAYGAQHAGGDTAYVRVAYSLVGLHLALDRGMSGVNIREAHQRMGRPDSSWPPFPRPKKVGSLTIADVAEAGLRVDSITGHATLVERWAKDVWHAWKPRHSDVVDLAARVVPNLF
jgi:Family of unknown function (DUF5946)